jgi:D-amino-acid oxidase
VNITVVGAGVVGLVTALTLEEHGHDVQVVAAATGDAITSAVAGACWFPYRAGPPDRVALWAAQTRAWLTALAGDPEAGVARITGYEITPDVADPASLAGPGGPAGSVGPAGLAGPGPAGSASLAGLAGPANPAGATGPASSPALVGPPTAPLPPWWAAHITVDRAPAPVTGGPLAWRYGSLAIEPARFLPWLARQLRRPIEHRPVRELAAEPGDAVVHCTGLAARELAGDDTLTALLGQVVITEVGTADRSITVTDTRDPDALFYLIPRRDELVLGGCSIPWPCPWPVASSPPGRPGHAAGPPPEDPALTARILAHAGALGFTVGAVRRVRVGLRPYRPEIRLERAGRIIHNYGHGGAGYTLCRGCADAVAALIA